MKEIIKLVWAKKKYLTKWRDIITSVGGGILIWENAEDCDFIVFATSLSGFSTLSSLFSYFQLLCNF